MNIQRALSRYNTPEQKIAVWNAFVDSELNGITEDDFSIMPRVLPLSYLKTIKSTCFHITKFTMELLSLPESEISAIIPPGPLS